MKCLICGGNSFHAHQVCYHDIEVDGDNQFLDNVGGAAASIYDCDAPYGPYVCTCCGAEYDELDGSQPTSESNVPKEHWPMFYQAEPVGREECWVSRYTTYKVFIERYCGEILSLYAVPTDKSTPMFHLVSEMVPKTGNLVVKIDKEPQRNKELLEKLMSPDSYTVRSVMEAIDQAAEAIALITDFFLTEDKAE